MDALKRIVITGPESSGKTTLARELAVRYGTVWVREMARPYLEMKEKPGYAEEDLLNIARLQIWTEDAFAAKVGTDEPACLFCDTDLITIRIWGEEKYGRSDPWVVEQTEVRPYDLWLLCSPDMPWEPDPLRENPHDRDRLFTVYERTLKELGKPYALMQGPHEQRMRAAMDAVEQLS
ncbi:MAG: ATP-binding protein [Flavobacteriales bacterium]|nr:ATP-binding protein [Flavobacteriales bacterium]